MTVGELIELLREFNLGTEIIGCKPVSDYDFVEPSIEVRPFRELLPDVCSDYAEEDWYQSLLNENYDKLIIC